MLSTGDIFTGGLSLLAFVVALYVLAARDQKTPYITTSVYSTALLVLAAILLSALAKFLHTRYPQLSYWLTIFGSLVLVSCVLNVYLKVWQAQNRKLNLRDDHLVRNLMVVRWLKSVYRSLRHGTTYEHDPVGLPDTLLNSIQECPSLAATGLGAVFRRIKDSGRFPLSVSLACRVSALTQADRLLTEIALRFLEHDCWVQYTTCTRHPSEFANQLRRAWEARPPNHDWLKVAKHVVTVDAYSPHFGFTDSIYDQATKKLSEQGVECITSKASFAGIHTAAAKAFNQIKARVTALGGNTPRQPTLVIYDGPSALVDLESSEQYRIFIRHLVPSERMWGGMFTLVVESAIEERHIGLLQSCSDLFVDLTSTISDQVAGSIAAHSAPSRPVPAPTRQPGDPT